MKATVVAAWENISGAAKYRITERNHGAECRIEAPAWVRTSI
jgi:hypothetical protein